MKEIRVKKIKFSYWILSIFFFLYFSVGSSFMLPSGEILRWIGPFLLLVIGILTKVKSNKIVSLWPSYFNLILPTFIISLFTLDYALTYGISKLLSFLLLISGIYSFINRETFKTKDIMSSFTIMSYFLNIIIFHELIQFLVQGSNFGEFSGSYSNKNLLSSLSLSSTICSLWLLCRTTDKKKRIFMFIFLMSSTIVTLATGSRTGFICLILIYCGSLWVFFENRNILQKLKLILNTFIMGLILLIIINLIEIPALDRILGNENIHNSTGLSRGETWINGFKLLLEKPLFGWGYGSSNYHIFVNNPSDFNSWFVHNSYITIMIENGILGGFLYVIFFLLIFANISIKYKFLNLDIYGTRFVKINIILILVLLVNAMTESFLFSAGNPMSIPFWYSLLSLHLLLEKIKKEKDYNIKQ